MEADFNNATPPHMSSALIPEVPGSGGVPNPLPNQKATPLSLSGGNAELARGTVAALATSIYDYLAHRAQANAPSQNNSQDPPAQITLTLTESDLAAALSAYVAQSQNQALPISSISPDFEANKREIQTKLLNSGSPGWTQYALSGTGAQIVQIAATATTAAQLGVEIALRESFPVTAQQESSIYACAINLGVTLARKEPARCQVRLQTANTALALPPWSQFTINGLSWFNRETIAWPRSSATKDFTLYQGTVATVSYASSGKADQTLAVGNSDWAISNSDVAVFIDGEPWARTAHNVHYSLGLWNYDKAKVFATYTDTDGNLVVQFGDGANGLIPPQGAEIRVIVAVTTGAQGNGTNGPGDVVACAADANVAGLVIDGAVGGASQKSAGDYKYAAPTLFSAQARPSTITDYNGFSLNYPGVIDSKWLGQQQLAPNDPSQAMGIRGVLLTENPFSQSEIDAFIRWLTGAYGLQSGFAGANIFPKVVMARPLEINISVALYCFNSANLSTVQENVSNALYGLFRKRPGIIGKMLALSDISRAIDEAAGSDIDYYDILLPEKDIPLAYDQYPVAGNIKVVDGGSYRVAQVNPDGPDPTPVA